MIEIHLSLLALTALAVVVTLALDRGSSSRGRLLWVVPVLLVGLVTQLLMLAGNKPRLEWLIPLVGILLIAWRCSDRVFRVAKVAAPIAAGGLAIHFIAVAHSEGATNAPNLATRFSHQRELAALKEAREHLPAEPGPVGEVELARIRQEWHSPVTGLYRVEQVTGVIWSTGDGVEVRD